MDSRFLPLLIVLSSTVLAAALGPPNGTLGTFDFRYPDIIVYPVVPCPDEGVFPHPRDCSWYYRCYDRYGYGIFWRAYFQCEPGTHFSDQLDQCVFQGDNRGCAVYPSTVCQESYQQCAMTNICPATDSGTAFVSTVEACSIAERTCEGGINERICAIGELYDATNNQCISERSVCRPSIGRPDGSNIICEDQFNSCTDYKVCRGSSPGLILRLCSIDSKCYHNTQGLVSTTSYCQDGQKLNAFTNRCVAIPSEMERCPGDALIDVADVPCVQETEQCQVYRDCNTREDFLACNSFFMCGNTRQVSLCSRNDHVFVPSIGSCISSRIATRQRICNTPQCTNRILGDEPDCVDTGAQIPPNPSPIGRPILPILPILPNPVGPTPVGFVPPVGPTQVGPTPVGPTPVGFIPEGPTPVGFIPEGPTSAEAEIPFPSITDVTEIPVETSTVPENYLSYVCTEEMFGIHPYAEGHPELGCSIRLFCNSDDTLPAVNVTGCDAYFECSYDTLIKKTCPTNQFYDYTQFACTNAQLKFGGDYTYCDNATQEIIIDISINCAYNDEIPTMSESAARLHCDTVYLCQSNGQFLGMKTMCNSFYQCELNTQGHVSPVLTTCENNMKLNIATKLCEPPAEDLCGFARYNSLEHNEFMRNLNSIDGQNANIAIPNQIIRPALQNFFQFNEQNKQNQFVIPQGHQVNRPNQFAYHSALQATPLQRITPTQFLPHVVRGSDQTNNFHNSVAFTTQQRNPHNTMQSNFIQQQNSVFPSFRNQYVKPAGHNQVLGGNPNILGYQQQYHSG